MNKVTRSWRQVCCVVALILTVFVAHAIAKPGGTQNKPATTTPAIDFSELDKLVPTELKEKNTPGAVIAVVSGDQVIYQKGVRRRECRD